MSNPAPVAPTLPPDPNAPIKLIAASQLALYAIHEELCTWASGRATFIQTNLMPSAQFITHTFPAPDMLISTTLVQLIVRDLWTKLEAGTEDGIEWQPEGGSTVPVLVTIPPKLADIPGGANCAIRHRRDERLAISIRSQEVTYGVPADGYLHTIYIWFGWL